MFCGIIRCPKCGAELDIEHDIEYPDASEMEMECHAYSFPIFTECPDCGVEVQCIVNLDISGIMGVAKNEDTDDWDWENPSELEEIE